MMIYMQTQRQQFYQEFSGFLSCDQFLVSKIFSDSYSDETIQPHQRVIFYIAIIQSKGEFVHVTCKMLGADMMEKMQDLFHITFTPNWYDVGSWPALEQLYKELPIKLLGKGIKQVQKVLKSRNVE